MAVKTHIKWINMIWVQCHHHQIKESQLHITMVIDLTRLLAFKYQQIQWLSVLNEAAIQSRDKGLKMIIKLKVNCHQVVQDHIRHNMEVEEVMEDNNLRTLTLHMLITVIMT